MKIKVLVVDDHDIVREGIMAVLEADEAIQVIGEAKDGLEAVEKSVDLKPDVILMDIRMPGASGIWAAKSIRSVLPNVKILALSAFDGDKEVFGSIEAGICGYILKDIRPAQLGNAIRTVYEGKSQLDPGIAHKVLTSMSLHGQETHRDGVELTKRENDVLGLLVRGLRNREIAQHLWISEKTVKVYVSRLFEKLKARSRTELVLRAVESNLVELSKNEQ